MRSTIDLSQFRSSSCSSASLAIMALTSACVIGCPGGPESDLGEDRGGAADGASGGAADVVDARAASGVLPDPKMADPRFPKMLIRSSSFAPTTLSATKARVLRMSIRLPKPRGLSADLSQQSAKIERRFSRHGNEPAPILLLLRERRIGQPAVESVTLPSTTGGASHLESSAP